MAGRSLFPSFFPSILCVEGGKERQQVISVDKLRELLSQNDEMPKVEFKLKYVLTGQGNNKIKDEVAKDIIALANTAGRNAGDYAYLIIGAGDELKADGTRDQEDVRQYGYGKKTFLNIVNARCVPRLPDLSYEVIKLDGNYYGVIVIPPSPHMHELIRDLDTPKGIWRKGSTLIRHGDEVAVASFSEMVLMRREKERLHASPEIATRVSDLLSKVQSTSVPLSQCVAEVLALAREVGHSTLQHICLKELRGWEIKDMDENSPYRPTYRLIEVYVGANPINMEFVGFGNASNTIEFLRHAKEFSAAKLLMGEPLSHIEAKAPPNPAKSIGSLQTKLGVVNPKAKKPDTRVYLYFSPFTSMNIIQAVRTELTKYLIELLPEVQPV